MLFADLRVRRISTENVLSIRADINKLIQTPRRTSCWTGARTSFLKLYFSLVRPPPLNLYVGWLSRLRNFLSCPRETESNSCLRAEMKLASQEHNHEATMQSTGKKVTVYLKELR